MTCSDSSKRETHTTCERILSAAEESFAKRGYDGTSLSSIADQVGVRSPSIYNHFPNKRTLYETVLERLTDRFQLSHKHPDKDQISEKNVARWLADLVNLHHDNPNLSRILQHAALSGTPLDNEMVDVVLNRMFDPRIDFNLQQQQTVNDSTLQPWAAMAFNNMVMSYITLAPIYSKHFGFDLLSKQSQEHQLKFIGVLYRALLTYHEM